MFCSIIIYYAQYFGNKVRNDLEILKNIFNTAF